MSYGGSGTVSNLYHYPYQRLAIRLRGAPATRDFRVVGMELRAPAQDFSPG